MLWLSMLNLLVPCATVATPPEPQGTVIKLNGPLAGDVSAFALDPSGTHAVFAADATVPGVTEIFSARCDGSAPAVRLDEPGSTQRVSFKLCPDGSRVILLRSNNPNGNQLFSRPTDASAGATLLASAFHEVDIAISPDSRWLVYRERWRPGSVVEYLQIRSVPIDGSSPPLELSDWGVLEYHIDPTSTRVVYRRGGELYSVRIDGSALPVLLHTALPAHLVQAGLLLTPDGRAVVYRVDQDGNGRAELFVVPTDGSAPPVRLVAPDSTTAVDLLGVGASATQVVYLESGVEAEKLWSLPLDGSAAPRGLGRARNLSHQLGGDWLVYVNRPSGGFERLWAVPLDGSAPPHELRDVQRPFPFQSGFAISPDSTRVVYGTRFHVLSVPIDGSQDPLILFPGTAGIFITPDSRSVILRSNRLASAFQLYCVPIAHAETPVRLNADLVSGGNVTEFQLSANGHALVYRADQEQDEVFELFALLRPDRTRREPAEKDGGTSSHP